MQSCDTNILLYAVDETCPEYSVASEYLKGMISNDRFVISDLVLCELYVLLRNRHVVQSPLSAKGAAKICAHFRSNPRWQVLECSTGVMEEVWRNSQTLSRAVGIYDLRLGHTLRRHGVTEFATRNVRDFKNIGFKRLINPID